MRKHILILSLTYYPKYVGGAEVAIKEITDRISDIEFHMVTLRMDSMLPAMEQVGNVFVHRIGFTKPNPGMADLKKFPLHLNKFLFQFTAFLKAASLHRKYKYDAVWGMMAHSTGVPAGLFKTFFPRVPYILTLQEGDPIPHIEKTMRLVWPLFVRGFTKADVIQVISNFLGYWARDMGYQGKPKLIPNAVDLKKFSRLCSDEERVRVREALGKTDDRRILITSSRMVTKNAVDVVISALPMLDSNVHFAILGIGPDEPALRMLAEEKGVSARVHFVGYVDHDTLPVFLAESDIFIRPSRSEGMGNSFIEAMAAGIPVIATQEGGIADFLFDAKRNPEKPATGWAVDKDSPDQVADAVKDILGHPEVVGQVTATAKAMVFKGYEWDQIAQRMREDVFNPALTAKG